MVRAAETFGGVLIMALLAGGLTEATLAFGGHGGISNDALLRPQATASPTPTAAPKATTTPTASAKPTSIPAPTATPAPTPAGPVATTNSFVHMRAGNSTATAIITDLNGGTVVQLLPVSDSQWQKVSYNGLVGYVFKTYLTY